MEVLLHCGFFNPHSCVSVAALDAQLSSLRSRYSEDMAVKDKQIQDLVMWQDKVASERAAEQEQVRLQSTAPATAASTRQ